MKRCKLLHNPGAGDEDHDKNHLLSLIEGNGYECTYASVKDKDWEDIESNVDFLVVAGGDGTVRKVVKLLLKRKLVEGHLPVALLPLGTANNVATTLELKDDTESLVKSWKRDNRKKFDIGRLYNVAETSFFMESFGYGIFPYLIKEMQKNEPPESQTPEESMMASLKKLHELIEEYKPRQCSLQADDTDHSGTYLLVEIMNTRSIGPNLFLAPDNDLSDGLLEIVVVPERDKEKFSSFIQQKINGEDAQYEFETIKARSITISWEGTHVHADDEVIKLKKGEKVEIEVKPGLIEFLMP